jgi:hypothetical protein
MKNILSRKLIAAVATSVALLAPLAVFGGSALAGGTSVSSAQYQYRVTVCHLTGSKKHPFRTIKVASSAVHAAIKGGGHVGPCTGTETRRAKNNSASSNAGQNGSHGKSGEHKKP